MSLSESLEVNPQSRSVRLQQWRGEVARQNLAKNRTCDNAVSDAQFIILWQQWLS